jgi:hypothetical protein
MTRNHPTWVSKDFGDSMSELLQSLQVVRDSVHGIARGRAHQVIPLSGQLRALLLENRNDSRALLIHATRYLGLSPTVFLMDGVDVGLPAGAPTPLFHLAGLPITMQKELPGQKEVALPDVAGLELIEFDGSRLSIKELIKFFANYSGGAHYSNRWPEPFARILGINVPPLGPMRNALLNAMGQIGRVTYAIGLDAVRSASELDVFVDLALPEPGAGPLIDAKYPDSPSRLTLYLTNDLHIGVELTGIDGSSMALRVNEQVDWSLPHIVHISVRHDDALATLLSLEIDDGQVQSMSTSEQPVFLPSTWHDYDVWLNSSAEQQARSSALAIGQLAVVGRSTPWSLARVVMNVAASARDAERKVVIYGPSSTGKAGTGQSDFQNTGTVRVARMSTLLGPK